MNQSENDPTTGREVLARLVTLVESAKTDDRISQGSTVADLAEVVRYYREDEKSVEAAKKEQPRHYS